MSVDEMVRAINEAAQAKGKQPMSKNAEAAFRRLAPEKQEETYQRLTGQAAAPAAPKAFIGPMPVRDDDPDVQREQAAEAVAKTRSLLAKQLLAGRIDEDEFAAAEEWIKSNGFLLSHMEAERISARLGEEIEADRDKRARKEAAERRKAIKERFDETFAAQLLVPLANIVNGFTPATPEVKTAARAMLGAAKSDVYQDRVFARYREWLVKRQDMVASGLITQSWYEADLLSGGPLRFLSQDMEALLQDSFPGLDIEAAAGVGDIGSQLEAAVVPQQQVEMRVAAAGAGLAGLLDKMEAGLEGGVDDWSIPMGFRDVHRRLLGLVEDQRHALLKEFSERTRGGERLRPQDFLNDAVMPGVAAILSNSMAGPFVKDALASGDIQAALFALEGAPAALAGQKGTADRERVQTEKQMAQMALAGLAPFPGESQEAFSRRKLGMDGTLSQFASPAENAATRTAIMGGQPRTVLGQPVLAGGTYARPDESEVAMANAVLAASEAGANLDQRALEQARKITARARDPAQAFFQLSPDYQALSQEGRVAADAYYKQAAAQYGTQGPGLDVGWLSSAIREGQVVGQAARQRADREAGIARIAADLQGAVVYNDTASSQEAKRRNVEQATLQYDEENRPPAPPPPPETPEQAAIRLAQERRTAGARPVVRL